MLVGAAIGLATMAVKSGAAGKLADSVKNLFGGVTKKKRAKTKAKAKISAPATDYSQKFTQEKPVNQSGFVDWIKNNMVVVVVSAIGVFMVLVLIIKSRR